MLTIINCRECGGSSLPFTLEWKYDEEFCKKCHSYSSNVKTYRFCSDKCLKKFVDRFAGHKHDWKPVEIYGGDYIMSFDDDKDIVKIEEKCTVCDVSRTRKMKGKEREPYKKEIDELKEIVREEVK